MTELVFTGNCELGGLRARDCEATGLWFPVQFLPDFSELCRVSTYGYVLKNIFPEWLSNYRVLPWTINLFHKNLECQEYKIIQGY